MRSNFKFEDEYITMTRGDTVSFSVEIEDLDQDLDSAYFTCKSNYTDESYAFQKSIGDGITKTDTGIYSVRIAPEDTYDLEPGKYFYDFKVGVNDDSFTILKGVLEIEHDVTREA